jgi:hypothetical protein
MEPDHNVTIEQLAHELFASRNMDAGAVRSTKRPREREKAPMGTVLRSKHDKQNQQEQQREDNDIVQGLRNPCGTPGTPLCQNPPLQRELGRGDGDGDGIGTTG